MTHIGDVKKVGIDVLWRHIAQGSMKQDGVAQTCMAKIAAFDLPSNAWFLCAIIIVSLQVCLYFRDLHLNTSLNWCCPASTAGKSKFSQFDIWIFLNQFDNYCDLGSQHMLSSGFQRFWAVEFITSQCSHFSGYINGRCSHYQSFFAYFEWPEWKFQSESHLGYESKNLLSEWIYMDAEASCPAGILRRCPMLHAFFMPCISRGFTALTLICKIRKFWKNKLRGKSSYWYRSLKCFWGSRISVNKMQQLAKSSCCHEKCEKFQNLEPA